MYESDTNNSVTTRGSQAAEFGSLSNLDCKTWEGNPVYLDSLRTLSPRPTRCPRVKRYYRGIINHPDGTMQEVFGYINCKQWDCEYCGPKNAARLEMDIRGALERLIPQAEGFRPEYFVKFATLTAPGRDFRDENDEVKREEIMAKKFKRWLRICKAELGYFDFKWSKEKQKDGTVHYHVIVVGKNIASYKAGKRMVEIWQDDLQMGWLKIKATRGGIRGIASYLAKYITKELSRGIKGKRVHDASKGFRDAVNDARKDFIGGKVFTLTEYGRVSFDDGVPSFTPLIDKREDLADIRNQAILFDALDQALDDVLTSCMADPLWGTARVIE